MTVFVTTDYTHAIQLEAVTGTSPGALAGTDFVRTQTAFPFKRVQARYDRDQDKDGSASILSTQRGRESCTWELMGDIIPSNVSGTPTVPDFDPAYEAHFGTKHTCTAHTTTAAGSSGVTLNLTPGGGAASGISTGGGDLIAIDVDATFGVEVRRVVSRAVDVVTLDFALSANPVAARNVYVGTTYAYAKAQTKTLHVWSFLGGNNLRQRAGGCIPRNLKLDVDWGQDTPVAQNSFSGEGWQLVPNTTTSEPTNTVIGLPLLPSESKWFWGATKDCFINSLSFDSDNGVVNRNNTMCSLTPTGAKRTDNNGRFLPKLTAQLLRDTTTHEGYFDNADQLTPYAITAQMGIAPGNIVAISAPKWIPDGEVTEIDGEVGISLSGLCYGTAGDDMVYLAFI